MDVVPLSHFLSSQQKSHLHLQEEFPDLSLPRFKQVNNSEVGTLRQGPGDRNLESWTWRQEPRGRKLEIGTEAETMEEFCLLACSSWLAQFPFCIIWNHLPGVAPPRVGWGPFHINHQPRECSTGQSDGGIKFPLPIRLSSCQNDKPAHLP